MKVRVCTILDGVEALAAALRIGGIPSRRKSLRRARASEPAASAGVGSERGTPWRYDAKKAGLSKAAVKKADTKTGQQPA